MLRLEGPFSAAFEGSDLAQLLSAGTRESLPVSFVHLFLIETSFNCFSFADESFSFHRTGAITSLSPAPDTARVLLGYYLWMPALK